MQISLTFQRSSSSPRIFQVRHLLWAGILVAGIGLGLLLDRHWTRSATAAADFIPNGSIRARPGPWGELYYAPFTIAAPDEILPVRALEATGTHWLFKKSTREEVAAMLTQADVTAKEREALLDPTALRVVDDGIDLTPPFEVLRSLAPAARKVIYQSLARFPENNLEITFMHKSTLDERFAGSGLASETIALFKELCCDHGDYVVFSGLASMLGHLPSYEEKLRFFKSLTRQKTMLFRLHITPESDVTALARYWGRGSYATDVRTMLESVSKVPGGTWIDILMVLPPRPSSELYFYPIVPDNPLNGPVVTRDCHWTSFNFFRDTPDPKSVDPQDFLEQLKTNYAPAVGDPRYGDLVMFSRPDGTVLHSAIYLADEIVFTKNGSTVIYPWMLSTVSDLVKRYSFSVPPGQSLTISYFRNKSL